MIAEDVQRAAAALIAEGERHAAQGAHEAALAAFRRATDAVPQLREAWQAGFASLAVLHRPAEARAFALAWCRASPTDRMAIGGALFNLGVAMRGRFLLGEAAACMRLSRELAPELPSNRLPLWAHLTALSSALYTDDALGSCLQVLADRSQAALHLPAVQLLLQRHQHAIARLADQPADGSYGFFPIHGQIELTGFCQLKCPFCRTGGTLKHDYPEVHRGLMTRETFANIMEQVPSLAYFLFYNWGEPLLHKDLVWFLNAAKELGKITEISTNMQFLPDALAEGIVRSGLNFMRVSCDGTTQEAYESYRKGGSIEKVLRNTRRLVEYKRKLDSPFPVIIYQMIVNRTNEHQADEFSEFARQQGADLVHIMGTSPATPEGYQQIDMVEANDPRFKRFGYGEALTGCSRPWTEISFDWNGDVHLCCNPSGIAEYRLGNINEQPFDEIWNGMRYRYSRRLCSTQQTEDNGFNAPCHTCFRRFPTREMAENDRWGKVVGPLKIGVG
jgi:MoaA/NifB/PqqE/SkfB family radical SAM enzyme